MQIKIDGKYYEAKKGEFILNVAKRNNIYIPTLCHNDGLPGLASCRLCIVEVIDNERKKVVTSCVYPITKEIEVITNSDKIKKMRRNIIMLLAARAPHNEKMIKLKEEFNVPSLRFINDFEEENCILCGLCVKACEELGTGAISTINRGITKKISTPYDEPAKECIGCGSCERVCPTGAIKIEEKDGKRIIWNKTFQLVKCSICGKYFATSEELEYTNKKLENKDYELICDKCKRKQAALNFKKVYKDVKR